MDSRLHGNDKGKLCALSVLVVKIFSLFLSSKPFREIRAIRGKVSLCPQLSRLPRFSSGVLYRDGKIFQTILEHFYNPIDCQKPIFPVFKQISNFPLLGACFPLLLTHFLSLITHFLSVTSCFPLLTSCFPVPRTHFPSLNTHFPPLTWSFPLPKTASLQFTEAFLQNSTAYFSFSIAFVRKIIALFSAPETKKPRLNRGHKINFLFPLLSGEG